MSLLIRVCFCVCLNFSAVCQRKPNTNWLTEKGKLLAYINKRSKAEAVLLAFLNSGLKHCHHYLVFLSLLDLHHLQAPCSGKEMTVAPDLIFSLAQVPGNKCPITSQYFQQRSGCFLLLPVDHVTILWTNHCGQRIGYADWSWLHDLLWSRARSLIWGLWTENERGMEPKHKTEALSRRRYGCWRHILQMSILISWTLNRALELILL